MAAGNAFLCFLLPLVVVIGTVCGEHLNTPEESSRENDSLKRTCPRREHWDRCNAACQKNCTNNNVNPAICPTVCKPGCVCNRDLVRGPDGRCIRKKDCPAKVECPEGEHFDRCMYSCQRNCSNWNQTYIPCLAICHPGCICDNGTVRSELPSGKCIKPEECKELKKKKDLCQSNEEYSPCSAHCQKNCTNWKEEIPCLRICVPGCVCKKGYVRGPKGDCILPKKCPGKPESRDLNVDLPIPLMCKKNEEMSLLPSSCPANCTNYKKIPRCLPNVIPACVCKRNFVRGPDGTCINPEKCPKEKKEEDCTDLEKFNNCGTPCEDTCENYRDKDRQCVESCLSGCFCLPGYVRNETNGVCIFPFDCKKQSPVSDEPLQEKCPVGEHYDECDYMCQRNCSNWDKPHIICPKMCLPGCVCNKGTVRSSLPDGKCIKPDTCPPKPRKDSEKPSWCPRGEHWERCSFRCQKDCSNWDQKHIPCPNVCTPGCVCDVGTVRSELPCGQCITPKKCPPKSEENTEKTSKCPIGEHWDECGFKCQRDCTNFNSTNFICPMVCSPGCVCDKGTVRARVPCGRCVKPETCSELPDEYSESQFSRLDEEQIESDERGNADGPFSCGTNEVYSLTISSCPDDCTNYKNTRRMCLFIIIPLPSCVCKTGFVKGPNGDCIKPERCEKEKEPEDCTDQEYYDTCGTACEADCKNYNLRNQTCKERCKIGCFCLKGRVRSATGKCVWPFDCPASNAPASNTRESNFCPPHEEFIKCTAHCELDCWTRNYTQPPSCPTFCVPGCRCVSGYVRGPEGTCIKPDVCNDNDTTVYPVERKCPENEVWNGQAHCQKNCTNPDKSLCPRVVVNGCVCKSGYLRRDDGKCVPKDQCPKRDEFSEIPEESVTDPERLGGCERSLCNDACLRKGFKSGHCAMYSCLCKK